MSLLDPFNPRPGPLSDDELHGRPADMAPRGGGKSFLWVPAVIVGGIGVLVVVAAL
jgi:hypothetical protein